MTDIPALYLTSAKTESPPESCLNIFSSSIEMKPMVIPIVAVLIVIVTLAGSIPAIRMLLRLRPAEVLHGR